MLAQNQATEMWSIKKSTLVKGPDLYYKFDHDLSNAPYCTATLNKSYFAMIAFNYHDDIQFTHPSIGNRRFAVINFHTQKVTKYPDLQFGTFQYAVCSASILHSKNYEKSLVVNLQTYQFDEHINDMKTISSLMSFNLNQGVDGQWKIHGTWEVDNHLINFWQIRGSFYSLFFDGNFIHHQSLYDWQSFANFSHNFTTFIGNGVIYYV